MAAVLAMAPAASAEVPMLLNYQGNLTDSLGVPENGTFSMTFSVYDAATGGNQLPTTSPWQETQPVQVSDGVFNVLLGSVTPFPMDLFTGGPSDAAGPLRFLDVVVQGEPLSPRHRVASAAYAVQQGNGTGIGGFQHVEVFSAGGSWTRPAGVSRVWVTVWGAGGHGGSFGGGGGGGGGGGYAAGFVTVSSNASVIVGTPGSAASGTSSFVGDTTVSATGGASAVADARGVGGIGTTGDIVLPGQEGVYGDYRGVVGGAGGGSPFGGAGGGGGTNTGASGSGGGMPGGGGGGGGQYASSGGGASGLVIVYY